MSNYRNTYTIVEDIIKEINKYGFTEDHVKDINIEINLNYADEILNEINTLINNSQKYCDSHPNEDLTFIIGMIIGMYKCKNIVEIYQKITQ